MQSTALKELILKISSDATRFVTGFKKAETSVDKLKGKTSALTKTLMGMAGVAGVGMFVNSILVTSDKISKLARDMNIATYEADSLSLSFQKSALNVDVARKAFEMLNKKIFDFTKLGTSTKSFDLLGMDKQYLASTKTYDIVKEIGKRIQGLSEKSRTGIMKEIFGRAGNERMIEALKNLDATDKKIKSIYATLGLSGAAGKNIEDLNDQFTDLKTELQLIGRVIVSEIAPAVIKVTEALGKASLKFGGYLADAKTILAQQGQISAQRGEGWAGATLRGLAALPGALLNFTPVMQGVADKIEEANKSLTMGGFGEGLAEWSKQVERAQKQQEEYIAQLEDRAIPVIESLKTETEKYNETLADYNEMLRYGVITQEQYAIASQKIYDAINAANPELQAATKLTEQYADEMDTLKKKMAEVQSLSDKGLIDAGTTERATKAIQDQLNQLDPVYQKYLQYQNDIAELNNEMMRGAGLAPIGGGSAQQASNMSQIWGAMEGGRKTYEQRMVDEQKRGNDYLQRLVDIMANYAPVYG